MGLPTLLYPSGRILRTLAAHPSTVDAYDYSAYCVSSALHKNLTGNFRPHRPHAAQPIATDVARSVVCLSVCLSSCVYTHLYEL